ncbi:MAG TPA: tetraacyldisaccharide 4'-kinase [Rhodanobacteraceae bacterium]|nr:tetraacyldisaccharide 4'-kinase [Rhodanobacteraceae bacterium]
MAIVDELQAGWYADRQPPLWALPIAALYGGVVRARRGLYRHGVLRAQRVPVPVIVVGNIVAGGAGKTPLTLALVQALHERGWRPGVVSRGYGGSARAPMLLPPQPDPAVAGDEPALLRVRSGLPVAVGAARTAAARLLLAEGVDVIVADDGLQHYALARDVEVCVIDGARRCGNGRLLPAGPLREPATRLRDVDFVVCNGGNTRGHEIPMRLELAAAVALGDPGRSTPLAAFLGQRVHAVAGIGNPRRFFDALRGQGIEVVEHAYPDHHRYLPADLAFGDERPVLMTEKDAIKCGAFAQPGWWSVPVAAVLPDAFFDAVSARLRALRPV